MTTDGSPPPTGGVPRPDTSSGYRLTGSQFIADGKVLPRTNQDTTSPEAWKRKKDGLKKSVALWIMRQWDAALALQAWRTFREEFESTPIDVPRTHHAMVAFVATYGRLFSGTIGLEQREPWVAVGDADLHGKIMELRNGGVAHSNQTLRRIRLSRSEKDGLGGWQLVLDSWCLDAELEQVVPMLRRLHTECERRTREAVLLLMAHCGSGVPGGEFLLDDL